MTKLTTPVEFDALLQKLSRAMRGADNVDAASALIALLFHRLTLLGAHDKHLARVAIAQMLKLDVGGARSTGLTLTESRPPRVTH